MKYKLKDYMNDSRIPVQIYKKGTEISFMTNHEVARDDRARAGRYHEFYKEDMKDFSSIGKVLWDILTEYLKQPDFTEEEFFQLTGMNMGEYKEYFRKERLEFLEVNNLDEISKKYSQCFVTYYVLEDRYEIELTYVSKRGKTRITYPVPSTGEKGLLTFDTPLEFDSTTSPEELGKMLMEAFDRSDMLTDYASGNKYPTKEIDMLDEAKLRVEQPRDKHFWDMEDYGVGEIYQLYSYLPSEDAESSANIFVGMAEELNNDMSVEHIAECWEKQHGKAESFETIELSEGIFALRAEMRNKKVHKISYLVQRKKDLLLECSMEVYLPGRRKKLDEKVSGLFEQFVEKCRLK